MPEVLILDWSIAALTAYRPTYLQFDNIQVRLECSNEDKELIASDPLLHQRIVDACQPFLRGVAESVKSVIQKSDQPRRPAEHAAAVREQVGALLREPAKQASEAAVRMIKSLQSEAKQYKKYKRAVTLKLSLGSLGLASSVLGVVAAAPTLGASLVFAAVSAYRALVGTLSELQRAMEDAEKVQRRVELTLRHLQRAYEGRPRSYMAFREVRVAVLNVFTGLPFPANISAAKADCELWGNKLAGVRVKSHQLSRELNKLLELTEHLKTEDWDRLKNASPSRSSVAFHAYEEMRQRIMGLLDKIPILHKRVKKGLMAWNLAKEVYRALEERSPHWPQAVETYFGHGLNLGLIFAGQGVYWADMSRAIRDSSARLLDWISTVGGSAVDIASLRAEIVSLTGELGAARSGSAWQPGQVRTSAAGAGGSGSRPEIGAARSGSAWQPGQVRTSAAGAGGSGSRPKIGTRNPT